MSSFSSGPGGSKVRPATPPITPPFKFHTLGRAIDLNQVPLILDRETRAACHHATLSSKEGESSLLLFQVQLEVPPRAALVQAGLKLLLTFLPQIPWVLGL